MKELVRVISKKRDGSDCISAAPAALDRYLAAQPSKADPNINSADLNC
jgi:hypothetical protein